MENIVQEKYEGKLKDGKKNGKGKLTYINGDVYDGNWLQDKRNGTGKMTWNIGYVYDGNWLNDLRYGQGELRYKNGDIYNGLWKENKNNGRGIMRFKNGNIYEGNWVDGKIQGKGIMRYVNGDIYDGDFEDGKRESKRGKMTYVNGDIYNGHWVNNKRHGHGILTINGIDFPGIWKSDIQIKEDKTITSVKIKDQNKFGTCWAHSISRTFVRTLQILGVILSEYSENFYLLFYTILVEYKDCNQGGKFEDMVYLFNYLKDNYKTKIFDIKKSKVKCNYEECLVNDNSILNLSETIKTQLISNFEYLFNNNLLFLAFYSYNIDVNGNNKPTKAIKTMLDYRLQPKVDIKINKYLFEYIFEQNNERSDIFPLVQTKDNIKERDNYECIDDTKGHGINLRRWKKNGVEFKNSWGENKASVGNFSVPDLKYIICEKKDGTTDTKIHFSVLMFDYNNLNQQFKEIVDNNIKKYQPTIDNSLMIEENNNYKDCSYDEYGFLNGFCKIDYNNGIYEGNLLHGIQNGKGTYTKNGTTYEGDMKYNIGNGKGKITYTNGNIYEGDITNGRKNNKGKMIYANGDMYDGSWINDKRDGIGKMTYTNRDIYEGDWVNHNRHGIGKMIYANGDIYDGSWINDKRHGGGEIISNGLLYNGDWENDELIRLYSSKFRSKYLKYKNKYLELKTKFKQL